VSSRRTPRAIVLIFGALLVLGASVPGVAATGPEGTSASPAALPACKFGDKKTRFRELGQWRKTLLDTHRKVGRSYKPGNLVPVSRAGVSGGGNVRKFVIADLRAMAKVAKAKGKAFKVRSAYRSYSYQEGVFAGWVRQLGLIAARKVSARAGHSEHQLGTTLDLQSAGTNRAPWDYADWAKTKPGRWLKKHAWEYGFVMSYPRGKASEVCYSYEPWHYRYVGRPLAKKIHESGKTPRRYLWQNFEST
jgi:D-alanyl-D-alanine carboxypeptidase